MRTQEQGLVAIDKSSCADAAAASVDGFLAPADRSTANMVVFAWREVSGVVWIGSSHVLCSGG